METGIHIGNNNGKPMFENLVIVCPTFNYTQVPTIGFISHMDTSPAVSGENVNVIIHKNYQGGDIVLPNDKTQIISVAKNPI